MLIISHRGAKGLAPENTRASFEAALKSTADMIEFDIRTSADGQLVINHDPILNGLNIAKTTYADLKKSYPELLTFKEVMHILGTKRPLLVEIKKGSDIEVVINELKHTKLPAGSVIGSFNLAILKAVRAAMPEAELMVIHKWSGVIATHRARVLNTKFIAMNHRWLWSGFIRSVTKRGFILGAYTMNNPNKAARWAKSGLGMVVTDYPDRFSS